MYPFYWTKVKGVHIKIAGRYTETLIHMFTVGDLFLDENGAPTLAVPAE